MAGGDDARDAVSQLEYSGEILMMLRDLDCMSHLSEDFWRFLEGQRFSGRIDVLPEGTRFRESQVYGVISGTVGEVLLFRSTFEYVLAFQVGRATAFAEVLASAAKKYPRTRLQMVDDGSRWSVGHGWSLWEARAAAAGGVQPLKMEMGVMTYFAGDELFLQGRES